MDSTTALLQMRSRPLRIGFVLTEEARDQHRDSALLANAHTWGGKSTPIFFERLFTPSQLSRALKLFNPDVLAVVGPTTKSHAEDLALSCRPLDLITALDLGKDDDASMGWNKHANYLSPDVPIAILEQKIAGYSQTRVRLWSIEGDSSIACSARIINGSIKPINASTRSMDFKGESLSLIHI